MARQDEGQDGPKMGQAWAKVNGPGPLRLNRLNCLVCPRRFERLSPAFAGQYDPASYGRARLDEAPNKARKHSPSAAKSMARCHNGF